MLDEFTGYRINRHQRAREWKAKTGGKVLGVVCCNVPEEIIHAAGMLPVRVIGEHEPTTEADMHFPANLCPYCKSWFDQLLKDKYDYLDGIVIPNVCNIVKSAYGFSKHLLKLRYARFLDIPQRISIDGVDYFTKELADFKKSLEELSGAPISNTILQRSINVYNQNRILLQRIYDLRKKSPPSISGSDVQAIVIASMLMPKEEHNRLLTGILDNIQKQKTLPQEGVRIFLAASMLDDTGFIQLIEDCGGNVVADDMPMGSRYFNGIVDTNSDPLSALANRYLTKIACPRKMLPEDRIAFSLGQMKDTEVKGAIIHSMRACDPHLYEYPLLRKELESRGLPVLFFRGEETETEYEQQKTDIEAFIEMIKDQAG